MSKIWDLIRRFFTKDRIAKVWKILFNGAITIAVKCLTNQALMDAAFDISLSILGLKATGSEKAAEFDARLYGWCEEHGVQVPSRADLNSIREIAYAAVRSQEEARGRLHLGK